MCKHLKIVVLSLLLTAFMIQVAAAYDVPPRAIKVKPYVMFLFPSSFWEYDNGVNTVKDDPGYGVGLKIRNQFGERFGLVFNASYSDIEVVDNSSGDVTMFTGGGYYTFATGFGEFIFDCAYGVVIAGDVGQGLLMPSLEYGRPVSDRVNLTFEVGWPIVNDWLRSFDFKENFSSFTLSVGTNIIF